MNVKSNEVTIAVSKNLSARYSLIIKNSYYTGEKPESYHFNKMIKINVWEQIQIICLLVQCREDDRDGIIFPKIIA